MRSLQEPGLRRATGIDLPDPGREQERWTSNDAEARHREVARRIHVLGKPS